MSGSERVLNDHGYHRLRVKEVVTETHEASSFVLEVPAGLRETFRYRSGQFCTFRVGIDGVDHLRSYSMSSAPDLDPDLTVTVKRVDGGLISNYLIDTVRAGDQLELTKPAGVFCPQEAGRPILGFVGGSGITPVMSIIKTVLASTPRPVALLYANRDRDSVIFGESLASLTERHHDRFSVQHHVDGDGGFLTADEVAGWAGAWPEADCYICGPGPFMDLVESTLLGSGVSRDRIFVERFLVEQQEKEAAVVGPGEGTPAERGTDLPNEVTIILNGKKQVMAYRPGDTVLETARRGGLRPPFSCEAGNCATCMAFLTEGTVRMRANNALSVDEVEEGWILTCQSLPTAPTLTVEYEAM